MARREILRIESKRLAGARAAAKGVKQTRWFIREVSNHITLTMRERVRIATVFLKNSVIVNIKRPVTKSIGPRGGIVVTNRSNRGEYPKADTTELMSTLITDVVNTSPTIVDGMVGSPMDYSLTLERKLNRSFLIRTLFEKQNDIKKILLGQSISISIS